MLNFKSRALYLTLADSEYLCLCFNIRIIILQFNVGVVGPKFNISVKV